jgi:hypothetical protein
LRCGPAWKFLPRFSPRPFFAGFQTLAATTHQKLGVCPPPSRRRAVFSRTDKTIPTACPQGRCGLWTTWGNCGSTIRRWLLPLRRVCNRVPSGECGSTTRLPPGTKPVGPRKNRFL